MNQDEKKIITRDNVVVGICIIMIMVVAYIGFSYITSSDYVERVLMNTIDLTDYWCEVKTSVPNNEYTGEIMSLRIGIVPVITISGLTDDALKRLYEYEQLKLQELPCYDLWYETKSQSIEDVMGDKG